MRTFILLFLSSLLYIQHICAQNYVALVTIVTYSNGTKTSEQHYIDEKGSILYTENQDPEIKEQILPFSDGVGRVRRNGKFGFMNYKGQIVIATEYEKAEDFHEGLAAIRINGKWGYINHKNDTVIKPVFESVHKFSGGLAAYGKNGKHGYINTKGEEIIKAQFDRVCHFRNNRAWVLVKGKWGCINTKGEFIISPYYSDTQDFREGYAWVFKDMTWGLIDSTNKYLVAPNERNGLIYAQNAAFETFAKFNNGLIISRNNDKFGYSDITLKRVIPATFDHAFDFENGLATVEVDGKWGIIDVTGKYVIEPVYKYLKALGNNFFAVGEEPKKLNILNLSRKNVAQGIYVYVSKFDKTDQTL